MRKESKIFSFILPYVGEETKYENTVQISKNMIYPIHFHVTIHTYLFLEVLEVGLYTTKYVGSFRLSKKGVPIKCRA